MSVEFKFEIGQWVMLARPEPMIEHTAPPNEKGEIPAIYGAVGMVTHRIADQCIGGVQVYYNVRIGVYQFDYSKNAWIWHSTRESIRFAEFELEAYNPEQK